MFWYENLSIDITYMYVDLICMKLDRLYLVLNGASLQRPCCFDYDASSLPESGLNEWMNEWVHEWMNEWMNGWMNELSTEYRNVSLTFRNFILKFSATSQEMVRGKSLDWIGQMEIWIYFPLSTPQFNSTWPYDASSIPIRELFQCPLSWPKNGPSRPKQTVNPNFGQTPIFFPMHLTRKTYKHTVWSEHFYDT